MKLVKISEDGPGLSHFDEGGRERDLFDASTAGSVWLSIWRPVAFQLSMVSSKALPSRHIL